MLGDTTINIGVISGGVADNVMAPTAEARLMARLVTPPEVFANVLREWVGARAEVELGITVSLARLGTLEFGLLTLAVHAEVPLERLRTMIYAYPTFHRAVEDALRDLD